MQSDVFRFGCCALLLALGCSKPADQGQGSGPEPFLTPQPPFLPPKVDVPRPCGDEAVKARFEACKAAASRHEQTPCEVAGGVWGRIGLHEGCNCPTGQGDCPCAGGGDCLAKCVSYTNGQGCPKTPAAGTWRCTEFHDVVGCHCLLDDNGQMGSICAD